MVELIQNAIWIIKPDIYLVSSHRHDFRAYEFDEIEPGTGRKLSIAVDGGDGPYGYARRVGALYDSNRLRLYEERCLTTEDPFERIAEWLVWGTRGKDGKSPLRFRPIKEFTTDHLEAILANCPDIGPWHKKVVEHWLAVKKREVATP